MAQSMAYRNPENAGYLLNVQADVNEHFATRVVVRLFPAGEISEFARTLNPVFKSKAIAL